MLQHWTRGSSDNFALAVTLDFFGQVEERLDSSAVTRSDYARRLSVDPSRVSQMFNHPEKENPSIRALVDYATAAGMKVAIVAYDDHDPDNDRGPIMSEVFSRCWEHAGRPRDLSMFETPAEAKQAIWFSSAETPLRRWPAGLNETPLYTGDQRFREYIPPKEPVKVKDNISSGTIRMEQLKYGTE